MSTCCHKERRPPSRDRGENGDDANHEMPELSEMLNSISVCVCVCVCRRYINEESSDFSYKFAK